MINKSLRSKIITGAVVASMMLSTSVGTFAADTTSTNDKTVSVTQHAKEKGHLSVIIDSLVESGDLSKDSADAIKTALQPQGMKHRKAADGMAKNNMNAEDLAAKMEEKLTALVNNGTITDDEKTAIVDGLDTDDANFKIVFETLVSDGTLTSERAEEIQPALRPQKAMNKNNSEKPELPEGAKYKNRTSIIESKLTELVDDGTITEAEKTATLNLLSSSEK